MGFEPDPLSVAAARGERWVRVEGRGPRPKANLVCSGCAKQIEGSTVFAATGAGNFTTEEEEAAANEALFCEDCRVSLLGPACRGCGRRTARDDAVVALDSYWHRHCFVCAEDGCGKQLAAEYFEHNRSPFCHEHYLERAAERCGKCELPVDGGLQALGRVWHDECLACERSGEPLRPGGKAWVHDGAALSEDALLRLAPRCGACKKPATSDRVSALGQIFHDECFRCVHCREVIGERRFVLYDDEPYLDGCYQKLFGASADPETRALMLGESRRYSIIVPLQGSLGPRGLAAFQKKQSAILPQVRRVLRERGITALHAFLFQPPAVSKPALVVSMTMPSVTDAAQAVRDVLAQERLAQEWDQLISGAIDTQAARNKQWFETITPEIVADPEADEPSQ